jgi:tripartite-type tricarboxylate transporter receptor subunit TctC
MHFLSSGASRLRALPTCLTLLAGALAATSTLAAEFPERTVKVVVPFPPGGGTDLVGRTIADKMGEFFKKTVVVENRAGAGTVIGTDYVAKSPPDGYTVIMGTFAYAVNPSLQANLPYSNATSFAPVALVARSPNVVVVNPDRPYKTIAELVAYAKANPGKVNYGSFGNGTSAHLAGALFANLSKTDLTHVPYKGSSPALTDLMGGQIDVMFTTVPSASGYIRSGKLRALAVTSAQRSSAFPDLPTVAEAGVPGYEAEAWYGFYVPAGTPAPVIARLSAAVQYAANTPAFQTRVQDEGLVLTGGEPKDLDTYVRAQEIRWRKIVQEAHIKTD